jgi:outer membrane protein assembly factor BamB
MALVTAVVVLAGAAGHVRGGDQTAAGGDAAGFLSAKVSPGQTGYADVLPVLKPKVRWKASLPPVLSHEAIQPVVANGGRVLYLSVGGFLVQADADKGTIRWKEQIKAVGHPAIHGNMLYVHGDKFVKAYDIGGDKPMPKWTWTTTKPFITDSKYCMEGADGIVVTSSLVLVGYGRIGCKYDLKDGQVGDTRLHAVNALDGQEVWSFDPGQIISPSLAVDEKAGLVFLATFGERIEAWPGTSPDGFMCAVELATGKEKWRVAIGNRAIASGPACADGVVYAGGETELVAVQAADGKELWRVKRAGRGSSKSFQSPNAIVTPDRVIVNMGRVVEAHARSDGALLWSQTTAKDCYFMVAARGVLYMPMYDAEGPMQALSLADGSLLWTFVVPASKRQCKGVAVTDGRLHFGNYDSLLFCLENE